MKVKVQRRVSAVSLPEMCKFCRIPPDTNQIVMIPA